LKEAVDTLSNSKPHDFINQRTPFFGSFPYRNPAGIIQMDTLLYQGILKALRPFSKGARQLEQYGLLSAEMLDYLHQGRPQGERPWQRFLDREFLGLDCWRSYRLHFRWLVQQLVEGVRSAPPPGYGPLQIMDFGCGLGRYLHSVPLEKAAITAYDINPERVQQAQQLAREQGRRDIQFRVGQPSSQMNPPRAQVLVVSYEKLKAFESSDEILTFLSKLEAFAAPKAKLILSSQIRDDLYFPKISKEVSCSWARLRTCLQEHGWELETSQKNLLFQVARFRKREHGLPNPLLPEMLYEETAVSNTAAG
jgi:Putative methyltransferase